jgi:hypothetical protein
MNSGLWIFRVTLPAAGAGQGGSGSAGSGSGAEAAPPATPAPEAAPAPDPAAARAGDPDGNDALTRAALAGLALGLLAVGAVVRSARRRRPG